MTCGSDIEFRSLERDDSQMKWMLFPNPSYGNIHIRYDSDLPVDVCIYDTNGCLVWTQQVQFTGPNHEALLETQKLVPGVYQLQIRQGNQTQSKRFVKI
jgi:hypothetical protein